MTHFPGAQLSDSDETHDALCSVLSLHHMVTVRWTSAQQEESVPLFECYNLK